MQISSKIMSAPYISKLLLQNINEPLSAETGKYSWKMLMEELIFNKMYFKLCLLITFLQWTNSTISTLIRVLLVIRSKFIITMILLLTFIVHLSYFWRKPLFSGGWKNNKRLAPFTALFLCCCRGSWRVSICCVTDFFCLFTLETEFILVYFYSLFFPKTFVVNFGGIWVDTIIRELLSCYCYYYYRLCR